MKRIALFATVLLLSASTFFSCEKNDTVNPLLADVHLNLDFTEAEDDALAISFGKPLDKSTPLSVKSGERLAESIHLLALRDAEGRFVLASPAADFVLAQLPRVREWPVRNRTVIRKTSLTAAEADGLREGEAAGIIREAFQHGQEIDGGQRSAPLRENDVFAIQTPDGDIILAKVSICIGVTTPKGWCIGIHIKKDK
jgi:hypothetical protein